MSTLHVIGGHCRRCQTQRSWRAARDRPPAGGRLTYLTILDRRASSCWSNVGDAIAPTLVDRPPAAAAGHQRPQPQPGPGHQPARRRAATTSSARSACSPATRSSSSSGYWYGDAAIVWMERAHQDLRRDAAPVGELVPARPRTRSCFIAPNNSICLFAGAAGMTSRVLRRQHRRHHRPAVPDPVARRRLRRADRGRPRLHRRLPAPLLVAHRRRWLSLLTVYGAAQGRRRARARSRRSRTSSKPASNGRTDVEAEPTPTDRRRERPRHRGRHGRAVGHRRRHRRPAGRRGLRRGGRRPARSTACEAVAGPIGARALPLDVTDPASVDAFCAQVPECTLLVNNAGGRRPRARGRGRRGAWRWMYEANVLGVRAMTRALLPALVASGDGHVVTVGSIAGLEAYPGGAGYNAAKFGARAVMGGAAPGAARPAGARHRDRPRAWSRPSSPSCASTATRSAPTRSTRA